MLVPRSNYPGFQSQFIMVFRVRFCVAAAGGLSLTQFEYDDNETEIKSH